MFSRRTRARIEFLASVLLASLLYRLHRAIDNDGSVSVVPQWFVAGAGYQIVRYWAHDYDFGAIRTSRWRRALLSGSQSVLVSKLFSRSKDDRLNFSVGRIVGTIGYRLWYGVLRPLPGSDE